MTPPPRQTVPAPLTAAYLNAPSIRSAGAATRPISLGSAPRLSLHQRHHRLTPPPNPQTAAPARSAGTSPAPPLTPPSRQTVPAPWTAAPARCAGASPAPPRQTVPAPLTPSLRQAVPAPLTAVYPQRRSADTLPLALLLAQFHSVAHRASLRQQHHRPTKPAIDGTVPLRWHFNGPALDASATASRPPAVDSGLPQRRRRWRATTRPISLGSAPREPLSSTASPPTKPADGGTGPLRWRFNGAPPLTPPPRQTVSAPLTAAPTRCAGASPAPSLTPPPRQTVPPPWTAVYPNAPSPRSAGAATRPISLGSAPRLSHRPAPTKPATGGTGSQRWHFTGPALDAPATANRARAVNSSPSIRSAGASTRPISLASAPRLRHRFAPTKPANGGTGPQRWRFTGPALDTPATANRSRALDSGPSQRPVDPQRFYSSAFIRQAARRSHRPAPTKPAIDDTGPQRWRFTGSVLDAPATANRLPRP